MGTVSTIAIIVGSTCFAVVAAAAIFTKVKCKCKRGDE